MASNCDEQLDQVDYVSEFFGYAGATRSVGYKTVSTFAVSNTSSKALKNKTVKGTESNTFFFRIHSLCSCSNTIKHSYTNQNGPGKGKLEILFGNDEGRGETVKGRGRC
jgi:hypothetical protein